MLKISIFLSLTIFYLKHQFAESIFCYECDAKWQPCADPADLNIIQYNTVPCLGSCVTSYNPYDGNVLYRTCSDALDPVAHLGGQFGTFNGNDGNLYYLCNTEK
ncbi:unnamed protein product [Brachionus calyciflorus]|uniref:Uncharacterized protein n=1 Tax=Brachionus calyciflorus TaxID=104777 RepID=A0A814LNJ5_9BILA|nr:unnamed protein product [Brachionus calyciflorus]